MGPRETVGVITGIATAGTLVVLILLIMAMVCKYCYFRWTRRKGKNLRRSSRSNKRDQPLLERMSRLDSNSSEVGEGNFISKQEAREMIRFYHFYGNSVYVVIRMANNSCGHGIL